MRKQFAGNESTISVMGEIPPPPDKLPEDISLGQGKKTGVSIEEHYRRLIAISEGVRENYERLLEQRTMLLRDFARLERSVASGSRTLVLAAVGAIAGMALYHLLVVLVSKLAD